MTEPPPVHLDAGARAVLRSLVPVICPADAVALADAILDHVELTLGVTPALVRHGFVAGLHAYDLAALPRFWRPARALTGERAERHFASWERGPTVLHARLARAFNELLSLACYEQPAMMARVGYRPAAWIAEVTHKRLTVFAADVAAQARALVAPDPLRPARLAHEVGHGRR